MFNPWTFLFQVLNFAVLAYVLHRLLYRPLHDAIDQRRTRSAQAQTEAEKARHDALELQQRLQAQVAEQERERQELHRQAREQAESDRRKLLAEAEQAVQRRQEETRQALGREREEMLQAIRKELVAQAVELARRLLSEACDTTLQRQLTLRLVEDLQRTPEEERSRLRSHWQPEDGAVLETAAELDGATLGQLTAAVEAVLGRPVPLAVQLQPALFGGVRLRVGGHLWNASLAGQLNGDYEAHRSGAQPQQGADRVK